MEWVEIGDARLYCGDFRDVLSEVQADVLVTDPPYGIGEARNDNASRSCLAISRDYGISEWDDERPTKDVFDELLRLSREQVIFGGNYFADLLPASSSWIVWDKDNGENDFADCELAWTSHRRAVRKVRWRWHGMLQERMRHKEKRVHPTQKPVGVMLWVIRNYTSENDTVLDPFMGSGTTGIACAKLGRKFIGIEREPRYFDIALRRITDAVNSEPLFAQGA